VPHRALSTEPLGDLARGKLVRILGPEQGERVFAETLVAMQLESLESADQLYAFSERLVARGGMEAAVGALLGVAAVMRGAAGRGNSVST
jgi:hypothetical protein